MWCVPYTSGIASRIAEAVAEEFSKVAGTRVNVAFSGSGAGFEKFCRGETQVSDASLITPPQVASSDDHRITLTANIDAGLPLEVVASRYHPVEVSEAKGRYTVSLANEAVPLDQDFELLWRPPPTL